MLESEVNGLAPTDVVTAGDDIGQSPLPRSTTIEEEKTGQADDQAGDHADLTRHGHPYSSAHRPPPRHNRDLG